MRHTIKIKQHDITDCGAACLASVASYYKLHYPIAKIRQLAGTDKQGTNLLGLLEAAQHLKFDAKGVKGDLDCLKKIPKPAIAHLIVNGQLRHYVVIYKLDKHYVKIMDPISGQLEKIALAVFKKQWTGVLLILLPGAHFKNGNHKISTTRRFWLLLRPHKYVLLQALVGAITYSLLGLSMSIYIQKITDNILVGEDVSYLNTISVIMIILLVVQLCIGVIKDSMLIKTGQQLDAQLIIGYYQHLLKLPQQFFDSMRIGELISRMNDAVKIRFFINRVSLALTINAFIVLFSFSIMFSYYWKLALILLAIIPAYLLIYLIINRLNKKTERTIMERSADFESQLVESLSTIGTIKSFGLEKAAKNKTEQRFKKLLKISYKSSLNAVYSTSSTILITQLFTIVILWVGSYYAIGNKITPGELLSFYTLVGYVTIPISGLVSSNKLIQNAFIAADRLFEIMDLELAREEQTVHRSLKKHSRIIFKDVCFRYGSRAPVFKKLNLTINHSQITAIIGESGSGKSSLIALLQKRYPIQEGTITISGVDLNNINLESLRNHISTVPQKIDIYTGTILENIAIGDQKPNIDRVVKICENIGILDFIKTLPRGFNTHIGSKGAFLSIGEKQRLAIARALYKSFELLILDEASSSIDSISENFIQGVLNDLRNQQKTIIVITHRLSTLNHADTIVFIDRNHSIIQGSHQELYKQYDRYRQFCDQQISQISKLKIDKKFKSLTT